MGETATVRGGPAVAGAVVRFWNSMGEPVGGGFMVGTDLIASCAHVVADAVDCDPYDPSAPAEPVTVDFPLLTGGGPTHTALVERWSPIAEDGTGDIAILRLVEPPPAQAAMPPLRRVDRLWNHGFQAFGFPGSHPGGVWSSGLIRGEQSTRWFQLQSTPGEQRVEGGFSGSPVWDAQTGAVVGMTVAADRGDTTTAYLIPIDAVLGLDPALATCPYRGLQPFDEEHAATFFGRSEEIGLLLDAVGRQPVTAVAGPSGVGKSSLVRAGLLPRLRAGGASIVDLRAAPGVELAARLDATREPGSVVVVDQFEELAAIDPAGARELLERLVGITATDGVRAVLTMRWAALDEVVPPALLGTLERGMVLVAPMSRARLREVIVGPAERSPGLAFEHGLVDRILDDAGSEPGQLPLVESLLTDLWHQRDGGRLTLRGYEAAGGVAGAVARHAERSLQSTGAAALGPARALFTALTRLDRDDRFVRRPVPLAHLPPEQRALVPALADGRLLVVGPDGTVELAHQALIDHWPRLRTWLTEDRAFLVWRARVEGQREQWDTEARADTALLRGAALAEAAEWLPARVADLGEGTVDYLRRSQARARWEVRRWRVVTAVLVVLALAAATLAVVTINRRDVLAGQLASAAAEMAGRASQARAPSDPVLAAQLALAGRRTDPASPTATAALAWSYQSLRTAQAELLNTGREPITGLVVAGTTALVLTTTRAVAVLDADGPQPRHVELPESAGNSHVLSPDGTRILDLTPDARTIRLRTIAGPAATDIELPLPAGEISVPRFSPDGRRLMWVRFGAAKSLHPVVWDLEAGREIPTGLGPLPTDTQAFWLTTQPDRMLLRNGRSNSPDTRLTLRSLSDGSEISAASPSSGVVEDGAAVVTCVAGAKLGDGSTVSVSGIGEDAPRLQFPALRPGCGRRLTADGRTLVEPDFSVADMTDTVRLTDLRSGATRQATLPKGMIGEDPRAAFGVTSLALVARPGAPPVVLGAQGASLLRFTTAPLASGKAGYDGTSREISTDQRYVIRRDGDLRIAVEDAVTGTTLAELPEAFQPPVQTGVGEDLWVMDTEADRWRLRTFTLPELRPILTIPFPASPDPIPVDGFDGPRVAFESSENDSDGVLETVSTGMLSTIDLRTGQPLHAPVALGATPEQHRWYQRFPTVRARHGHPGQAVVADDVGALQLRDTASGAVVRTIPTTWRPKSFIDPNPPKFAIDPTGARLALLTPEATLEIWDLDTATMTGRPVPAPGVSDLLGFTSDGMVAVEFEQEHAAVIDPVAGREIARLQVPSRTASLDGDGSAIAVKTLDGEAPYALAITVDGWRDKLCAVLDRPLSDAELAQLPEGADRERPCR
ncbi:serine protease [Pseudonocardia sp. TRM90224]|uniref:serine protease n=1 Tax=Pseudonocardia sp. TRM90224 TaxID=2812678 RepID=UPI001E3E99B3|nr:serine protease [Pseudonocardia sp. TRM90224]